MNRIPNNKMAFSCRSGRLRIDDRLTRPLQLSDEM